jgi:hypothetical protein
LHIFRLLVVINFDKPAADLSAAHFNEPGGKAEQGFGQFPRQTFDPKFKVKLWHLTLLERDLLGGQRVLEPAHAAEIVAPASIRQVGGAVALAVDGAAHNVKIAGAGEIFGFIFVTNDNGFVRRL